MNQNKLSNSRSGKTVSSQTRRNWLMDVGLFFSGLLAALTGIYFLYLPSGYQGGRNPMYNVQILFERATWDDLHTWSGVIMIVIAIIHIVLHWPWVISMTRRSFKELTGQGVSLNARSRWNLFLNMCLGVSFVLTAISGVYFLFVSSGRGAVDPNFLFSRTLWDMIHTWAGTIMIATAVIHFAIHWKWVTKVTAKVVASLFQQLRFIPILNSRSIFD